MKSVAVVSGFERFKGSTFVARGYCEALTELGYETHWYQCGDSVSPPTDVPLGRMVHGIATGHRGLDQGLNFAHIFPKRLGRLTEDIVLLTDPLLLRIADVNPGSLVIVHDLRELHYRTRSNIASPILSFYLLGKIRRTRGVFTDTEATRGDLVGRIRDLPPTEVVHSAAPVTGNGPEHIRRSLSRLTNQRTQQLLYVAVDRPYKHVKFVVDLARHLDSCPKDVDVRILLVSKLRRSTVRYVERTSPRCLTVLPEIEDITEAYNQSDVLVFPSEFEGFGLPLIEAMSFGMPIVASPAEAILEVLGGAGTSVPGYEVASWSRALIDLRTPSMYEAWAYRALERAPHFSQEAFRHRLRDVLTKWGV